MKLQTPHVPLDGFNLLWEKKEEKLYMRECVNA